MKKHSPGPLPPQPKKLWEESERKLGWRGPVASAKRWRKTMGKLVSIISRQNPDGYQERLVDVTRFTLRMGIGCRVVLTVPVWERVVHRRHDPDHRSARGRLVCLALALYGSLRKARQDQPTTPFALTLMPEERYRRCRTFRAFYDLQWTLGCDATGEQCLLVEFRAVKVVPSWPIPEASRPAPAVPVPTPETSEPAPTEAVDRDVSLCSEGEGQSRTGGS
jgi:hypothetical protein